MNFPKLQADASLQQRPQCILATSLKLDSKQRHTERQHLPSVSELKHKDRIWSFEIQTLHEDAIMSEMEVKILCLTPESSGFDVLFSLAK